MKFRRIPSEIDAIQFNGENWTEVQAFVGTRKTTDGGFVPAFNPIGTFLVTALFNPRGQGAEAELWVEANHANVYIQRGEWILKDEMGFYPCKDDMFRKLYEPIGGEA